MDASEDEKDAGKNELLELLNKALSPPDGDVVISVESYDHALLRELWTLKGEGVEITEVLQKSGSDPGTVYLVLKDIGIALGDFSLALVVVKQALELVKSHTQDNKKNSKTEVRTRKNKAKIEELLEAYKDVIKIDSAGDDDDDDDSGEDG